MLNRCTNIWVEICNFAIRRCGVLQLVCASLAKTNISILLILNKHISMSSLLRLFDEVVPPAWFRTCKFAIDTNSKNVASFNSLCFVLFLDGHRCMKGKARHSGRDEARKDLFQRRIGRIESSSDRSSSLQIGSLALPTRGLLSRHILILLSIKF